MRCQLLEVNGLLRSSVGSKRCKSSMRLLVSSLTGDHLWIAQVLKMADPQANFFALVTHDGYLPVLDDCLENPASPDSMFFVNWDNCNDPYPSHAAYLTSDSTPDKATIA